MAVEGSVSLALDLLLKVRNDGALVRVAVACGWGVDFLPQWAQTGGLGAERSGGRWARGEELFETRLANGDLGRKSA